MTYPTLYKPGKRGQIVQWSIEVVGATMHTRHGLLGGLLIHNEEVVLEGKNLGRKNATTPEQQARAEAESRWEKKVKHGYSTEIVEAIELPYTRPMLAEKYLQHAWRVKSDWLIQPKLNGIRCVSRRISEDEVTYSSRNGTTFAGLGFLTPGLLLLMDVGEELDGELYLHGMSLQEISSLVRKSRSISELLAEVMQYHVFDVVDPSTPFLERFGKFQSRFKEMNTRVVEAIGRDAIHLVSCTPAVGEENIRKSLDILLEAGYEGLMLRSPSSLYLSNYRSHDLLKYKLFQDKEFVIIGGRRGRGKDKDIVIWRCATEEGKEFDVKMSGSYADNAEIAQKYEEYIGKMMTVQFQEITPYGVPEFPVGLEFRDYECDPEDVSG